MAPQMPQSTTQNSRAASYYEPFNQGQQWGTPLQMGSFGNPNTGQQGYNQNTGQQGFNQNYGQGYNQNTGQQGFNQNPQPYYQNNQNMYQGQGPTQYNPQYNAMQKNEG